MNKTTQDPVVLKISTLHYLVQKIISKKNFLSAFDDLIFSHKTIEQEDSIFVAGSPRSGTTWLMDILLAMPNYAAVMEPVNPQWFPKVTKIGFSSKTYLSPDKEWREGEIFLKKIFTGKIQSQLPPYTLSANSIMKRILANKLVIKSIRLNRMLPWIIKRFQFKSMLFIIRHPCAVINSQMKSGFTGYNASTYPYQDRFPTKEDIIREASELDGLNKKLLKKLEKIKAIEEILAASWCLDNFIPSTFSKPNNWITLSYEKLLTDANNQFSSIFKTFDKQDIVDSAVKNLNKPSIVTLESELNKVGNPDIQLSKWKKSLSKEQIKNILNIVSDFGLDFYSYDVEPNYKKLQKFYKLGFIK